MEEYRCVDATARAREIAAAAGDAGAAAAPLPFSAPPRRALASVHPAPPGPPGRDVKLRVRSRKSLTLNEEELDLSGVEQLVEASQTRAVGEALLLWRRRLAEGAWSPAAPLAEVLRRLDAEMDAGGLDALVPPGARPGNLARPRALEIAAAVNRLRCAVVRQLPA
jgi:hypothetical protein